MLLLYEGNIWSLISKYHEELAERAIDRSSLHSDNSRSNSSNTDNEFKHSIFEKRSNLCAPTSYQSKNVLGRAGTLYN